ncbi:hypothetical protein [Streptomyces sp. NPDC058086]|uniref:hypothetical protein n=1 Tax=Streptomyces sp. NPDC058086 TaxID=3346334 RepID=UPI0036E83E22
MDAGRELLRLITTILDPVSAPAMDLASSYADRWEQEGANAELQPQLRGPGKILG